MINGRSLVRLMEHSPVIGESSPAEEIIISACGELQEGEEDGIVVNEFEENYEDYPSDDENDVSDPSGK